MISDPDSLWKDYDGKAYRQNSRCLSVNTILAGKYLVGPVLGQGGFGITYQGYDLNMETRIAIKEYFPVELVSRDTTTMHGDRVLSLGGEKSVTYKQGLQKYVAEAQNVSRFSETPGVVSVKDFFYENETAYIVMEYIQGESLKDYLKERGGRLTEEESLAILKPVIQALIEVHKAGIIHRDISPDNIMLTFEAEGEAVGAGNGAPARAAGAIRGGNGAPVQIESIAAPGTPSRHIRSVKLIDFGAARMTAKNDQKSLTIILKHGYAPEEQYRTHGEQGPWTDVYAICAVLYRMLTGETPVPAMDRLFSDDLKPVGAFGVKVSKHTADTIMKGLAVKKENRISSMERLFDALYEGKAACGQSGGGHRSSEAAARKKAGTAIMAAAAAVAFLLLIAIGTCHMKSASSETAAGTEGSGQLQGAAMEEAGAGEGQQGTEIAAAVSLEEKKEEIGPGIVTAAPQTSICAHQRANTLFVMPDGTVEARGDNQYGQCMVQDWNHIAAVACGNYHSLGLREDGIVKAAGANGNGQCDTENWKGVTAIAAGAYSSFGLLTDGTVAACGRIREAALQEIAKLRNIRVIAASDYRFFALDNEGMIRVIALTDSSAEEETFCGAEFGGWEKVKYLVTGIMYGDNLMGICEDGSILRKEITRTWSHDGMTNRNFEGLESWTGVKQLEANTPALAVLEDGTVQYLDNCDENLKKELDGWTDIMAITSSNIWDRLQIFGLKEDGTILEYMGNAGNATPETMLGLEWIDIMAVSNASNLAAKTKDGRILTCGTEPFRMQRLTEWKNISESDVTGIVGSDAVLLKDGRVYTEFNMTVGNGIPEETGTLGTGVKEAVELWGGSYGGCITYGYAFLHEGGTVEIKTIGEALAGTGAKPEEYLAAARQAENWTDIVQIVEAGGILYGLCSDGTLRTTSESNEDAVAKAKDLKKIALWDTLMVGIREDGTVEVIFSGGYDEIFGRTQLYGWTDLTDIAVGESHVVGLRSDGTVLAAGSNHCGQCEVEDWTDIVSLKAGENCTLGITSDGTLKMAGSLY